MKAAVLYGNEDIRYTEVPTPKAGAGEVKVRVRAAGICGSDVPRVLYNGAHYYPIVLGHEFSGDVVQVGEGVDKIKIGDRVSVAPLVPCMKCSDCLQGNYSLCKNYAFIGSRVQGAFADYVVVPQMCAVKYDPSIPYDQAAMFEPATVALHGLFCADYKGGENVAVLGCGTIGVFTIQWAKIFGAKRIVAFDIDEGRLALAKRMGADACVNTKEEGFIQSAAALIEGEGFKYVFEVAGNINTMKYAFDLAGNKASLCYIGTPHEAITFTQAQWEKMNRKEFSLTGSWMSYSAPYPGREWDLTAHYFRTGQLKFAPEFICKTYPMAKAQEAFSLYKNPEDIHGKIMLVND